MRTLENNDWQLEDPETYLLTKYYTRSTDGKGHSEKIWIKVPPGTASMISMIIQSKAIPDYKTAQDFFRDAVYHRLHYLSETGAVKGIDGAFRREICIQEILWQQERYEAFTKNIESAKSIIKGIAQTGKEGIKEAKKLIEMLTLEAMGMQDSTYWRNCYLQEIKESLEPLIKEGD